MSTSPPLIIFAHSKWGTLIPTPKSMAFSFKIMVFQTELGTGESVHRRAIHFAWLESGSSLHRSRFHRFPRRFHRIGVVQLSGSRLSCIGQLLVLLLPFQNPDKGPGLANHIHWKKYTHTITLLYIYIVLYDIYIMVHLTHLTMYVIEHHFVYEDWRMKAATLTRTSSCKCNHVFSMSSLQYVAMFLCKEPPCTQW